MGMHGSTCLYISIKGTGMHLKDIPCTWHPCTHLRDLLCMWFNEHPWFYFHPSVCPCKGFRKNPCTCPRKNLCSWWLLPIYVCRSVQQYLVDLINLVSRRYLDGGSKCLGICCLVNKAEWERRIAWYVPVEPGQISHSGYLCTFRLDFICCR